MVTSYRWHDEIEVCFYTNLNCSVWRIVREKKHFIHAQQTLLLTQNSLVQGSGLQLHVKEKILFSRALPGCYFRILISTQLAQPVILVTRNKTMWLCCVRTKRAGNEVITACKQGYFLRGRGFREFGSDKRCVTRFHTFIRSQVIQKNKNTFSLVPLKKQVLFSKHKHFNRGIHCNLVKYPTATCV